jgi:hypothetical protein
MRLSHVTLCIYVTTTLYFFLLLEITRGYIFKQGSFLTARFLKKELLNFAVIIKVSSQLSLKLHR